MKHLGYGRLKRKKELFFTLHLSESYFKVSVPNVGLHNDAECCLSGRLEGAQGQCVCVCVCVQAQRLADSPPCHGRALIHSDNTSLDV